MGEGVVANNVGAGMRAVVVHWVDSAQPTPSWQFLDDIDTGYAAVRCATAGFVLRDDDAGMVIAASIGSNNEKGKGFDQACGVMRIPRRAIVEVNELGMWS